MPNYIRPIGTPAAEFEYVKPTAVIDPDVLFHTLCNRIVVAVPFQSHRGFTAELSQSLVAWKLQGIEVMPVQARDGFLEIIRGHIVSLFLEQKERDYLIMIDSDISPPIEAPITLIQHNVPVVGAACVVRNPNIGEVGNFSRDGQLFKNFLTLDAFNNNGLIEVDFVGTGLIGIQRKVLEAIDNPFVLSDSQRRKAIKTGTIDPTEDQRFCQQVIEAGYPIYVDIQLTPKHLMRNEVVFNAN